MFCGGAMLQAGQDLCTAAIERSGQGSCRECERQGEKEQRQGETEQRGKVKCVIGRKEKVRRLCPEMEERREEEVAIEISTVWRSRRRRRVRVRIRDQEGEGLGIFGRQDGMRRQRKQKESRRDRVKHASELIIGMEEAVSEEEIGDIVINMATRLLIGAGARALFYPSLLYNVVRNKLESEFRWWDYINQYLVLGAVPFPGDVLKLKELGVHGVITLNEPYETLVPPSMYKEHNIDHLEIPTRDFLFAPSQESIQRAVDFIHSHTLKGQGIYVHCKAGRGRSTTVVLCYLVAHCGMTPREALEFVQAKRPRVSLAPAQWQAVKDYSKTIQAQRGDGQSCLKRLQYDGFDTSVAKETSTCGSNGRRQSQIEMCFISKDGDEAVKKSATKTDTGGTEKIGSNESVPMCFDCSESSSDLSNEECEDDDDDGDDDISFLGTSVDLEGYCSEDELCFWNGNDNYDAWGMQRVGHCVAKVGHSAVRTVSDVVGAAGAMAAWSLASMGCLWIAGRTSPSEPSIFVYNCNPCSSHYKDSTALTPHKPLGSEHSCHDSANQGDSVLKSKSV
ncbi:hypothetical protein CBR_g9011 [Chara braunii]|uniref:phosphatidylglycerophosphatase n=1 Tax=Chara braunii TaxID=69332 RepID=A0A388KNI6_CHABU|nr:hypothetical protein CBR_g9011 [Chara braunii]|eukprot:GBG71595.1 hypothetical protein CBR_g9011 [Chara braunii]